MNPPGAQLASRIARSRRTRRPRRLAVALAPLLAVALLAAAPAGAAAERTDRALVSIIIDDMGYVRANGLRALELPGALTYSFLPHTPYAARLAALAAQLGKEVMLHLPMEAEHPRRLGPGSLTRAMNRDDVRGSVLRSLASIPHARGVNNHMGSALTREASHMHWVMDALRDRGALYFVDSRTTEASVAEISARRAGLPSTSRDVFLDHDRNPKVIAAQLAVLAARARARGSALGIAHPYPETLAVLEERLGSLAAQGIELVPVSRLIGYRLVRRRAPSRGTQTAASAHPVAVN